LDVRDEPADDEPAEADDPRERGRDEEETAPLGDAAARPAARPGTINGLPWGEYLAREYAAPRRIAHYDVGGGAPYAGLIAPAPGGYRWRQQTSGILCAQRELGGIYLPLPDPTLARGLASLHVGCCSETRDDQEARDAYRAAHPDEVAATAARMREHRPDLAALQESFAAAGRPLGITPGEADRLDALLRGARLPLRVGRERLERGAEAWVWVRVAGDVATWEHEFAYHGAAPSDDDTGATPTGYRLQWLLAALAGTEAVLTWENCD